MDPFSPIWSVRLFFHKAKRDISIEEIKKLLEADDSVNIGNHNDYSGMHYNECHKRLENHPMFKKLSGHPHAISLIAPMVRDYSLVGLYELISSKSFVESQDSVSHPLNSLKFSMDTSV